MLKKTGVMDDEGREIAIRESALGELGLVAIDEKNKRIESAGYWNKKDTGKLVKALKDVV